MGFPPFVLNIFDVLGNSIFRCRGYNFGGSNSRCIRWLFFLWFLFFSPPFFRGVLQETFAITDYYIYDDGTSDKSNMYDATNTSLTFDTDHYVAVSSTTSSASNYMGFIEPTNMPTLSNFSIECDIKSISGTGQSGLNYIDGITTASASQKAVELISAYTNNMKGLVIRNPNFNGGNRVNGALSTNTWYTFKLQFNGTSITAIISQNGSDVYSRTITDSVVQYLEHMCIYQADASSTIHFKNLKIKAL